MTSISEETHGQTVTTIVSVSGTPGGEAAEPLKGVKENAEYPLGSKCSLLAQDGSFPKTTLTFPWESDSFLFKTGH